MENFKKFEKLVKKYNFRYCSGRVFFCPEGKSRFNLRCLYTLLILLIFIIDILFCVIGDFTLFKKVVFFIIGFSIVVLYLQLFIFKMEDKDYYCYKKYCIPPLMDNRLAYVTVGKIIDKLKDDGLFTKDFFDNVIEECELFLSLECSGGYTYFSVSLMFIFIAAFLSIFIQANLSHPIILRTLATIILGCIYITWILSGCTVTMRKSYQLARKSRFFATIIKKYYLTKNVT